MRFKLYCCEVLLRETCAAIAASPHVVDPEFLPKGLHDRGGNAMRVRLQELIDMTPAGYDAILFGYALCGTGLSGLHARDTRLVIPRAHDCIALLMGSQELFNRQFAEQCATYYRSPGWIERGSGLEQLSADRFGVGQSLGELIDRYGEENGRFLYEELHRYKQNYRRLTYIRSGVEPDNRYEDLARAEAEANGWELAIVEGGLSWFVRLVDGDWDEKSFLVVPPGDTTATTSDERILISAPTVPLRNAAQ